MLQSVSVEGEQPIRLPVVDKELLPLVPVPVLVLVERAGQSVTVGAQDVIVYV